MTKVTLTGGFTPMDEGVQVLRIYGVEYKEQFGNLTVYMVNAKGQTMRETFRLKGKDGNPNEGASNAFSFFAKTAMDDFNMEDIDPSDMVDHYILVEVVHNEYNGKTYANLGREKQVAYEFDVKPVPEALTMTLKKKPEVTKPPVENPEPSTSSTDYNLDDLLG